MTLSIYSKLIIKIILLTSLLSIPVLAETEPPQFFVGVKGGQQWALDDNYNHSNPESTILGIYSGLQFTPSWSWDLGYQYHDELKADAISVNVKTWLIESAFRYDWYLQDDLSVYGRFGAAYWDIEKTHLSSSELDATGFSPFGEVGVNYNVTPSVRISAGYQYIDSIGKSNTGKYDSYGFLVGFTYTFARTAQPIFIEEVVPQPVPAEELSLSVEMSEVETLPQTFIFSSETRGGLFVVNSTDVSQVFVEQLAGIASTLKTYPQSRAVIVGHTDSSGAEAYNQVLSERRAQAAANKLFELGVSVGQIEVHGMGESHPIADNRTAEGRALNRRIEVTVPSFQYQREVE